MNKKVYRVSVAMAAYNGEAYIVPQIESILKQLKTEDELVISLDPSTDATEMLIREFRKKDSRVRLVRGKGKGLVKNFANAIYHCKNEIIFLSDQDDVWYPNKVESVLECFNNKDILVVMHDAEVVSESMTCVHPSFMEKRGCRTGVVKNIVKNSYIGCCMAFRNELKKYILPFPENIPMHDQWIGVVGEIMGMSVMIDLPLIHYRRHGNNASSDSHASMRQMLQWRVCLILNLLKFCVKYKFSKE